MGRDERARERAVRDPWGPLPRQGAITYTPGLLLRAEGDRMRSDGLRMAVHSMELANLGVSRAVVIEQTEWVLESDGARSDADSMWLAVLALLYTGDLMSANAQCERLARDPVWAGSARHQGLLMLLCARSSLLSGDAAGASDLLTSLLARKVTVLPVCLVVSWLIEALVHLGELDRAHEVLLAHDLAGRLGGGPPDRAQLLAARGALHMAAGQFRHAIDDYTACGRILAAFNVGNPAVVTWRSKAAFAALAAGRHDLALALAEDELIAARKWGAARGVGTALHAAAMARRDETSVALLEEAAQLLDLGQARTELMHVLYDLGTLLIERKDVTGGRSRLGAAGEVARACGNSFWAQRVRSALERVSGPDGSPALTRQELKIAQMARAGYSNRRIAETLFLTVRTVEFHLSSVYRKLGISGRRELVAALGVAA
ncbi:LuxR family transcriptional regulator [Streptomyces rectiverticillatus]|uniref:helix-turn-helix transcriptional regulator n=1 Tax=Streptomyces rectiverticillatus TaxID=173860 RepID=UPI0015C3015A|nr:helix-turn-helix transcriptional regulator [Streptomyces rectiverticillatus]QLE70918.1 LuxR family transcriptional regulator [Streptomyces rectiverticillatus]